MVRHGRRNTQHRFPERHQNVRHQRRTAKGAARGTGSSNRLYAVPALRPLDSAYRKRAATLREQAGASGMMSKAADAFPGRVTQRLLDLLYPPHCAGCQRSGHVLCPSCLAQIPPLTLICQRCSGPLSAGYVCESCRSAPLRLNGLRAVSAYQEPLRSYIHALKYDGNKRLAQPLGLLLAGTYRASGIRADALVPVPLHSERQQRRGYNHAALLARVCAAQAAAPLFEHMLIRHRATLSQVGLQHWERQQNVQGAFSCSPAFAGGQLRGRTILLIDDVSTTAATLEACAAPLFAVGAAAVFGLVLARPVF